MRLTPRFPLVTAYRPLRWRYAGRRSLEGAFEVLGTEWLDREGNLYRPACAALDIQGDHYPECLEYIRAHRFKCRLHAVRGYGGTKAGSACSCGKIAVSEYVSTQPAGKIWARTKITIFRYRVACNTPQCDGLSAVKTDYGYRAYDVFRLEDGAWIWCGYGNGRAILPKYVRKRLAEGRPAEFVVEGYRYCIKRL